MVAPRLECPLCPSHFVCLRVAPPEWRSCFERPSRSFITDEERRRESLCELKERRREGKGRGEEGEKRRGRQKNEKYDETF